jgi:hypothetical protein
MSASDAQLVATKAVAFAAANYPEWMWRGEQRKAFD